MGRRNNNNKTLRKRKNKANEATAPGKSKETTALRGSDETTALIGLNEIIFPRRSIETTNPGRKSEGIIIIVTPTPPSKGATKERIDSAMLTPDKTSPKPPIRPKQSWWKYLLRGWRRSSTYRRTRDFLYRPSIVLYNSITNQSFHDLGYLIILLVLVLGSTWVAIEGMLMCFRSISVAAQEDCSIVYVTVPGPIITVSLIGVSATNSREGTYYYSVVDGTTQWLNSQAPPSRMTSFVTSTLQITVEPSPVRPTTGGPITTVSLSGSGILTITTPGLTSELSTSAPSSLSTPVGPVVPSPPVVVTSASPVTLLPPGSTLTMPVGPSSNIIPPASSMNVPGQSPGISPSNIPSSSAVSTSSAIVPPMAPSRSFPISSSVPPPIVPSRPFGPPVSIITTTNAGGSTIYSTVPFPPIIASSTPTPPFAPSVSSSGLPRFTLDLTSTRMSTSPVISTAPLASSPSFASLTVYPTISGPSTRPIIIPSRGPFSSLSVITQPSTSPTSSPAVISSAASIASSVLSASLPGTTLSGSPSSALNIPSTMTTNLLSSTGTGTLSSPTIVLPSSIASTPSFLSGSSSSVTSTLISALPSTIASSAIPSSLSTSPTLSTLVSTSGIASSLMSTLSATTSGPPTSQLSLASSTSSVSPSGSTSVATMSGSSGALSSSILSLPSSSGVLSSSSLQTSSLPQSSGVSFASSTSLMISLSMVTPTSRPSISLSSSGSLISGQSSSLSSSSSSSGTPSSSLSTASSLSSGLSSSSTPVLGSSISLGASSLLSSPTSGSSLFSSSSTSSGRSSSSTPAPSLSSSLSSSSLSQSSSSPTSSVSVTTTPPVATTSLNITATSPFYSLPPSGWNGTSSIPACTGTVTSSGCTPTTGFTGEVVTQILSYGNTQLTFVFPSPTISTTVSYYYPSIAGVEPTPLAFTTRTNRPTPLSSATLPSFSLFTPAPRTLQTLPSPATPSSLALPKRDLPVRRQFNNNTLPSLPVPALCGEYGNFTLSFDDSYGGPDDNGVLPVNGMKNPYHHLFYANGFAYVADRWEPFPAISQPNVALFFPIGASLLPNTPFAGTLLPGQIGAGPRASVDAYWFDAFSGWFGCGLSGITSCTLRISGYRYDTVSRQEVLVAEQSVTIPACWLYINCKLTEVVFDERFRALSGIQFNAFTGVLGIPQVFMMDELKMAWWNNTCSAGILRIGHR